MDLWGKIIIIIIKTLNVSDSNFKRFAELDGSYNTDFKHNQRHVFLPLGCSRYKRERERQIIAGWEELFSVTLAMCCRLPEQ